MKNRRFLLLPALLGLLLTGCGDSDEPSGEGEPGGNTGVTQYTVTFKDENGETLDSRKWDEGATPSYSYTKNDTAEWDYTVEGWSLTQGGEVVVPSAVSADATYFAVVSQVKRSYTVTFYNESGTEIKSESLEYGAQPSCTYIGPSDDAQWDYTFSGWSTTQGGTAISTIPTVSGDASYYAVVSKVKQRYEIKFYDENSTLLAAASAEYGDVPSYTYNKQDTQEWNYTMSGWATAPGGTPLTQLPSVTGNASYYAIVSQEKQQYTVTFITRGDSTIDPITREYGSNIEKPDKPTKEGYSFVSWSYDENGEEVVSWPLVLEKNETLYGNWNETIDIKGYLQTLLSARGHNPYSYIPDSMKPTYEDNFVNESEVTYDFTEFNSVSNIKYGGFGEQWHMVIENIKESERYYNVLTIGETMINASVVLFNNYLDQNPGTTADHSLNESTYTAKIDFHSGVLKYSLRFKSNINIPFFGEVTPQIDMILKVTTMERIVRVQLTENNAMKYVVGNNFYTFGLEYGISTVSRKAYFSLIKDEEDNVEGHIYEFVQYKDKDLVPSCADFYISVDYTSVVGNKASAIPGFTGIIDELYTNSNGKLVGYKVNETFTKWGFSATYHTLWFNLNNISGISNVKAISNGGVDPHENNHDIYLNSSASIFEPTKNEKKVIVTIKTSRKYDVEMRKQYFYNAVANQIVEYEREIPMMFIQDDHDEYTNYTDFEADILADNGITAHVNLSNTLLAKIRDDYENLIPVFEENKELVNSAAIVEYIGEAENI